MAPRHSDGQKRLFCPTKGLFFVHGWAKVLVLPNEELNFWSRMGKNACFAQRRALFPATDGQKCLFRPTKGRVSGFWNPKRQDLGHGGVYFRVRDTKKAGFGVQGRGGGRSEERRRKAEKGGERDNSRNEKKWAEIVSQRIRKFGPEQNGESKAGRPIGQSKRAAAAATAAAAAKQSR